VYEEDTLFVPKDLDRYDSVGLTLALPCFLRARPLASPLNSRRSSLSSVSSIPLYPSSKLNVRCPPSDAIGLTSCFNCSSPDLLEAAPPLPLFG
jgi:hypothetical protein